MVKRTITITTILLILSIAASLIIALNRASFAADDDIASGTSGTCSWVIDKDGVLTISPTDGVSGMLANNYNPTDGKWYPYRESITKVIINTGVKSSAISSYLFYGLTNCTEMDLTNLDTSNTTEMGNMFGYCSNLTTLDVTNFNTSKVTSMFAMFSSCNCLTNLNLIGFNTSKVTRMEAMFSGCRALTTLDVTGFNTSKVTNMSEMFSFCEHLTSLDLTGFDTSKVTNMKQMFYYCSNLTALNLSGFDTSNVESMYGMFWRCSSLTYLNVAGFNTSKVTSMYYMFCRCEKLTNLDVTSFNTSNVINMGCMFGGCNALTSIDVTGFDTHNVSQMGSMFSSCKNLTSIDLSNFNTSSLSGDNAVKSMFENCFNIKRLDLNHFNTSAITNFQRIFASCNKLEQIDIKKWNVSNGTNFNSTFEGCKSLTSLDLSEWETSSATTMTNMFRDCRSLTNVNISNFDTYNVNRMEALFANCSSLRTIDISSFDTRNVTSFNVLNYRYENLFEKCNNLNEIVLGEQFDFDGNNINSIDNKAIFPDTNNPNYTNRWIREDGAYGPYTAVELINNYDGSTMAGTWIRERKRLMVTYNYTGMIPQGASSLPEARTYLAGEEVTVASDATALGYTFSGWSKTGTFTMPMENVVITGSFTANIDTPYKVEHYLEDLNEGKYNLTKTDNLTGETDAEATGIAKDYEGFTFDESIVGTNLSGTISADGSLVLKLYYKRNSYNISYSYTGNIPDGASELPENQTYKYEEEISLPENPSAPGYTFSGWQTDYITMPAEDIEITGYFIKDDVSKEYKIEYYFDGEKDDSLDETMNAEINQEVSIDPQKSLNFNNTHYSLVSDNHKINVSENTENNIIRVYYETDVLDYNNEESNLGDGISDKYQVKIIYKVQNGTWDDGTSENKKQIINLYDKDGKPAENGTGKITIPQVGNKPAEGYSKGSWNAEIPEVVSNKDNGKEYIYSYAKIGSISKIKGNLSNPKTDDIVQRYAIYGAIAILLMLVVKKTINKYSRKKRKIQF